MQEWLLTKHIIIFFFHFVYKMKEQLYQSTDLHLLHHLMMLHIAYIVT